MPVINPAATSSPTPHLPAQGAPHRGSTPGPTGAGPSTGPTEPEPEPRAEPSTGPSTGRREPPTRAGRPGHNSAERRVRTAGLVQRLRSCDDRRRAELQEELILVNQCVAESIAGRYAGRGVAAEDVRQVACEALVKAVRRFDPDSGKDLLSFAVPTITGEIKRHFRDHGWAVRPPRRIQELQQRMGRVLDDLRHELDREPEAHEIAERLGVTPEEYEAALGAYGCFAPLSLDQPRTEGGRTLGDGITDDAATTDAAEARVMLAPLVRELPARDRRILYLRFFEDRTQAEIGEDLGITQTQVSRLLSGIYGALRESLDDEAHDEASASEPQGVTTPAGGRGRRGAPPVPRQSSDRTGG